MGRINKMNKTTVLTIIGMVIMALLILTKIVPTTQVAGISVFVGIIFFFIVEGFEKTPSQSGLQFKTFIKDLKKPGVLFFAFLPIVSAIATLIVGDSIFSGDFSAHVIERTSPMLSFDKIPLLIFQVVIAALGEEIAWRGFFVGKSMKIFPFWLCAVVSSILFAAGHIAVGDFGLVFYDIATIFIDSLIYAMIYRKSGNCLVSTLSHILCNATGMIACFILK